MANHEHRNDDQWVDERLNALEGDDPGPDIARAWTRLRDRTRTAARRKRRMWVAVAGVCVGAVVLPWPRAAAQRLWDRLMLDRVEVVRVERSDVPYGVMQFFEMKEREPMVREGVVSLDDAERLAGFRPVLPAPDVLGGAPVLSVVKTATLSTEPMRVADLRKALANLGASDLDVPKEWEGVRLTVDGGPIVIASYPEAMAEVMQTGPLRMTMPPGFQFDRFMEIAFRLFGRNAAEAKAFAAKVAANPALLMVVRPGDHAEVREVPVPSGVGVLVGDPDGSTDICLFLNLAGRLYIIAAAQLSDTQTQALARSFQ